MPGVFDKAIVYQIQQANDIVDVISEHLSLSKKGKEMVGLCPFHEDHRPSLYVNSTKQIFKCFACSAGGDVFKFVQMQENLSFPQAIERLAERAGIKLQPSKFVKSDSKQQPSELDPNTLAKVNNWAAKHFQQNLSDEQKGKEARKYISERQIKPESVKKWQLGLAASEDSLVRAARTKNIPMKLLAEAGLVVSQRPDTFSDKFVNRLMFPIVDVTSRIIGFGGRTLDDKGPKYINSPATALFDKSNSLYGLNHARTHITASETAVVVEGYTDCLMAHQFSCTNVVATLGTSFTTGHARILRRYAKKIVLIFDSDTAGIEAANRAIEVCLSQKIDIKITSVPQGKDPCDFLLAAGKEKFEQLINDAVDVFQFKWNRLTENFDNNCLIDNKAAIEEFLQTIAVAIHSGNLSAIDMGLIVNRLSNIIALDAKQINNELARRLSRVQKNAGYSDKIAEKTKKLADIDMGDGYFAAAQREILEVLLNDPKLFDVVKQKITAKIFNVPILSRIAAIVFETLTAEPNASLAVILSRAESVEESSVIVQLAQAGEEKGNFQSRLAGALEAVRQPHLQTKKSEIKTVEEQTQFLRRACESIGKQNPHSPGMT